MDLIIWLIIGGVIGWVASIIMKTNAEMGILENVVAGVIGSLLGGWLFGALGGHRVDTDGAGPYGILGWVFAILGACIVIWLWKTIRRSTV